jgi:transposase InsO family protein
LRGARPAWNPGIVAGERRRPAASYDNAVAESFFATVKKELVHRRSWPTRHELTSEVFEYIEAFYNRVRRHSTLDMLSPLQFEDSTLGDRGISFAASRLRSSQNQIINN